jgi:hypothetical protein
VHAAAAARAVVGSKESRWSLSMSLARRMVVSGVRSSWETSETKRCCTSESSASSLIWASMLSAIALNERPRIANSSSPAPAAARRDRRRRGSPGFGGLGDRNGHRAQHEGGDRRDQEHQPGAHEPQGDLDELQGLLLRGEVVGEVELVGADLGKLELLPDDDPGTVPPSAAGRPTDRHQRFWLSP